MSQDDVQGRLRDAAFTLTTPFTNDGTDVDLDGLIKNIEAIYDSGGRLFVPIGNTGEYYSLSDEERVAVVSTTVDAVGEDGTVLAGAGGSTKQVVSLANRYDQAGADGVMVMHPTHTHVHEQGLIDYYRSINDATDLPLVIYKRGEEISQEVLQAVTQENEIVGVKYASPNISGFSATINEVSNDVVWINGLAERYAPSFALAGATGFTTGVGNFLPKYTLDLQKAIERNEYDLAEKISERLRPLEEIRDGTGKNNRIESANNVSVVKYGLELAGLSGGPVREPLRDLDEEYTEEVKEIFNSLR